MNENNIIYPSLVGIFKLINELTKLNDKDLSDIEIGVNRFKISLEGIEVSDKLLEGKVLMLDEMDLFYNSFVQVVQQNDSLKKDVSRLDEVLSKNYKYYLSGDTNELIIPYTVKKFTRYEQKSFDALKGQLKDLKVYIEEFNKEYLTTGDTTVALQICFMSLVEMEMLIRNQIKNQQILQKYLDELSKIVGKEVIE